MKMREMKRKFGASGQMSVWPPQWSSSYEGAETFPTADEGVLTSVKRMDNRLSLTMQYQGREHVGTLEWTPPPSLDDVETLLKANIGNTIKAIGEIEV